LTPSSQLVLSVFHYLFLPVGFYIFKIFYLFFYFKLIFFFMFSYHFNVFPRKNNFKNNHNHTSKHALYRAGVLLGMYNTFFLSFYFLFFQRRSLNPKSIKERKDINTDWTFCIKINSGELSVEFLKDLTDKDKRPRRFY
jgi:hypothetical protein